MKGERLVGGLRCTEVLAQLDAFADGSIAPDAHAAVVAHVSGCTNCERFGGTYAEVVKRLRAVARPADPDRAVFDRLRAKLDLVDR